METWIPEVTHAGLSCTSHSPSVNIIHASTRTSSQLPFLLSHVRQVQYSYIMVLNTNIITYHFQYQVSHMHHHIHNNISYRANHISHVSCQSPCLVSHHIHVWYLINHIISSTHNSYTMNYSKTISSHIYIYHT